MLDCCTILSTLSLQDCLRYFCCVLWTIIALSLWVVPANPGLVSRGPNEVSVRIPWSTGGLIPCSKKSSKINNATVTCEQMWFNLLLSRWPWVKRHRGEVWTGLYQVEIAMRHWTPSRPGYGWAGHNVRVTVGICLQEKWFLLWRGSAVSNLSITWNKGAQTFCTQRLCVECLHEQKLVFHLAKAQLCRCRVFLLFGQKLSNCLECWQTRDSTITSPDAHTHAQWEKTGFVRDVEACCRIDPG